MSLSDRSHPLWGFLKFLCVCGVVGVALWKNSNRFDANEIKAWGEIALALLAGKYGLPMAQDAVSRMRGPRPMTAEEVRERCGEGTES